MTYMILLAVNHDHFGQAHVRTKNVRCIKLGEVLKQKTKLPQICPSETAGQRALREKDKKAKETPKAYTDIELGAQSCKLDMEDKVLVKQQPKNMFKTPFSPDPYVVQERKGSMITASRPEHTITRNSLYWTGRGR